MENDDAYPIKENAYVLSEYDQDIASCSPVSSGTVSDTETWTTDTASSASTILNVETKNVTHTSFTRQTDPEPCTLRNPQTGRLINAIHRLQARHANTQSVLRQSQRAQRRLQKNNERKENIIRRFKRQYLEDMDQLRQQTQDIEELIASRIQLARQVWQKELQETKDTLQHANDQLQSKLMNCQEEKDEIEQTLDVVQNEMKTMMEEMNEQKQDIARYQTEIEQLQDILDKTKLNNHDDTSVLKLIQQHASQQTNNTQHANERLTAKIQDLENSLRTAQEKYQDMVHQHRKQKREVIKVAELEQQISGYRKAHEEALKRSHEAETKAAESELRTEVAKAMAKRQLVEVQQQMATLQSKVDTKTLQSAPTPNHRASSDMESVLQRTLAQRDAEIARLRKTMDQNERHAASREAARQEQLKRQQRTVEQEVTERMQHQFRQESDIYELQRSRELRQLACTVVELETELEIATQRHAEYMAHIRTLEKNQTKAEATLQQHQMKWKASEKELRNQILQMERKIIGLEEDAMRLYGKNLDLAHQLGKWAP
ncbi:uncharacterized protein BYT42DRAFT_548165 [Radiomyces spectabilis]|uniref:uncharacterized protein n=1 Tax=Radiomyces spectabilis TaxID=64574 RepID=UPI00221FAF4E|nr:uncharacterized protein BYT42DRAFT_548165 [Radiomyces spectabilis]KAI8373191.1 hypothetical protein BYT42DRAFT_548165 [Radiomyces spectabilis]